MANPGLKLLATAFLSALALFAYSANAMEIRRFDRMADQDQGEYVGLLVQGAEKVLRDEGKADLAAQVSKLFLTIPAGDKMSLGMTEFERNLALLRVTDAENARTNPNDPRIEVEDAMVVTLRKNGIPLPESFYTVTSGFKPKVPPAKN